MSRITPSDKSSSDGEWWREDKSDHDNSPVEPETSAHDSREAGKNKFDEEMKEVRYPT